MIMTTTSTLKGVVEAFTTFAYPTHLMCWNAGHQGIIGDIVSDYCSCSNQSTLANSVATDNSAVCTQRGAFLDEGMGIDPVDREMSARSHYIGEDATGPAENIVLEFDSFVERDIVLDANAIADADIVTHIDILTERTIGANASAFLDVAEMPNFGSVADFDIIVDVTTLVNKIIRHRPYLMN